MRSRYSAFAVGDGDYLWRTWHPRTRPENVALDPRLRWTGLEIVEAVDDLVEFRAQHDGPDGPGCSTSAAGSPSGPGGGSTSTARSADPGVGPRSRTQKPQESEPPASAASLT